jgi:hypothetical protein
MASGADREAPHDADGLGGEVDIPPAQREQLTHSQAGERRR